MRLFEGITMKNDQKLAYSVEIDMTAEIKFVINLGVWDRQLGRWRRARASLANVLDETAWVHTEGFCAYAFVAGFKRGSRLPCGFGDCLFHLRVAGKLPRIEADPQVGTLLVDADDFRKAIFPLSIVVPGDGDRNLGDVKLTL
jgi:hypothetical protein